MGRSNPSRETKFSGTNADREISIFSVQLTSSRIGSLTQLILTLAICGTTHMTTFRALLISLMQTTVVCIVYNYDSVAGVDRHAHVLLWCQYCVRVRVVCVCARV